MEIKIRCFRCNEWLWKELEKFCEVSGQTASMFIRAAIVEKLQRVEGYEKLTDPNVVRKVLNENNLRKIENIVNREKGEE